jgi:adenosylcobinamide-GDP ribazoletransferase
VNALRLLFGTLTILPVRPPTSVDRRTAGWAMALSPLAGLALAVVVVVPVALLDEYDVATPPFLTAVLVIGALAVLTRAIHLDGLADVADGLGSGKRGEDALAIMKKSDIGPFGVVTLVLVLLLQVTALADCVADGSAPAALFVALLLSRTMLIAVCGPAFGPARPDGLGAVVAGSVTAGRAVAGFTLALVLIVAGLGALAGLDTEGTEQLVDAVYQFIWLAFFGGLGAASWAARRFGGVTGDVYGAVVEVTFTATLVMAALA